MILDKLEQAVNNFEEANNAFREIDAKFESQKKINEIKFMEIKSVQDGKNESEKDRLASVTQDNKKLVHSLNLLRQERMTKLAKREGADARLDQMRQVVSYHKELLNKGLIEK